MTPGDIETRPQTYARIGGLLYLIIIVAGAFAELFVRSKLIVPGDATATAKNIMASEPLCGSVSPPRWSCSVRSRYC